MTSGVLYDASWLVTDRTAGTSQGAFAFNNMAVHVGDDPAAVAVNRAALADQLGVTDVVFPRVVHGDQVARVDAPGPDVDGVDALITNRPGLGLAVLGADCVMIAMATPDGWVAAVHCGWQGLVRGVVPATLRALVDAGADTTGVRAHLGPGICAACYPVDAERAAAVAAVSPVAVVSSGEQVGVDVRAGVLEQLRAAGVEATWDPRCTAEDPDLYSYRRDHRTGRQALAIAGGLR